MIKSLYMFNQLGGVVRTLLIGFLWLAFPLVFSLVFSLIFPLIFPLVFPLAKRDDGACDGYDGYDGCDGCDGCDGYGGLLWFPLGSPRGSTVVIGADMMRRRHGARSQSV